MLKKIFRFLEGEVEMSIVLTDEAILSKIFGRFMRLLLENVSWKYGDKITTTFNDDGQVILIVSFGMTRYRRFVRALRSSDLDLKYNSELKAAEVVKK